MKLVGKIGSPQSAPPPSAGVLSDALALITAFGRDKAEIATAFAAQIKVAKHNEQVRDEAKAATAEAENAIEQADRKLALLEKSTVDAATESDRREQSFAAREADIVRRARVVEASETASQQQMDTREAELDEEDTRLAALAAELDERDAKLEKAEARKATALAKAEALEAKWKGKLAEFEQLAKR